MPLNLAVAKSHLTIVKLLLEIKANKDIVESKPLNLAVRNDCLRMIKLLLEKKVNKEVEDKKG